MAARRHRRVFRSPLAGLLLLAAQLGFGQGPEPPSAETTSASRADLERLGATIRAIHITVDNVFDLTNPEEDKQLYRWANRVHVRTRQNASRERAAVRGWRFVSPAGSSKSRRVRYATSATWPRRPSSRTATTRPRTASRSTSACATPGRWRRICALSRSGGKNKYTIGVSDSNLFGTGKKDHGAALEQRRPQRNAARLHATRTCAAVA